MCVCVCERIAPRTPPPFANLRRRTALFVPPDSRKWLGGSLSRQRSAKRLIPSARREPCLAATRALVGLQVPPGGAPFPCCWWRREPRGFSLRRSSKPAFPGPGFPWSAGVLNNGLSSRKGAAKASGIPRKAFQVSVLVIIFF